MPQALRLPRSVPPLCCSGMTLPPREIRVGGLKYVMLRMQSGQRDNGRRSMRSTVDRWSLALVLAFAAVPTPAAAETYRWLQYGPGGLEARAVTDEAACPSAQIDGA